MKIPFFLIGCMVTISLATSCATTSQLTMTAKEPAPVSIPADVMNIGIVNRSLPSKDHEAVDEIDKILSVEGKNLDRHGAEAAVVSLRDGLIAEGRFENVVTVEDVGKLKQGLGVLPATLTWDQVEALCDQYAVDMIFSLAYYDTDTKVDYELTTIEYPNDLGIKVPVPGHKVTLKTRIRNGWRVYDPYHKRILDEYAYNEAIVARGSGLNPVEAVKTVINRKEAIVEQSRNIGSAYAARIKPYSRRVTRDYFVRGTDNFKLAQRRAQTGDWDGAAQLWEQELSHPDEKVAGRAYYNMAVSSEINGDLNKAMEYASKSYADFRNDEALHYLDILRYRQRQQQRLDRQLGK